MTSILKLPRPVRRRLEKVIHKSRDIRHARRAHAILLLADGHSLSETARLLKAGRAAVRTWKRRFEQLGEAGLVPASPGRPVETVTEEVCQHLLEWVAKSPNEYGFLRSRWTSEMLAEQVQRELGIFIHPSTVRRVLPKLGVHWKRARPTLNIRDPKKEQKIQAIDKALSKAGESEPVFYVDEVDIGFNPRIGACWSPRGRQATIPTPGQNQKRYLAGALNARTGNVVWVEWHRKNAEIFIRLMAELRKRYRRARRITLILDNYVIHKSAMTKCFLSVHGKFRLLFQPVYHPWVNRIELVWKQLHDTVTRNHRFQTMDKLMKAVRAFMNSVSPFPGNKASLTRL